MAKTLLLVLWLVATSVATRGQIISTFAGTGVSGFGGDGGPASAAKFWEPRSIATDASGNIFVADLFNNRVRKIDTLGIITTFAGNGSYGTTGDGGPATAAQLSNPLVIAVDASGNVYFFDFSYRIRKVSTSGIISTYAGIVSMNGYSGDGGPATGAKISTVAGLATDTVGNLYILGNSYARMINSSGIISRIAGTGTPGFSGDGGLASAAQFELTYGTNGLSFDNSGNYYIGDGNNRRIRKVNTAGIINTIAGTGIIGYSGDGGSATAAELYYPVGLTFDNSGNLYFCDLYNNVVRRINSSGSISTIAGTGGVGYGGDGGPATAAYFNNPSDIAVDTRANIYICDVSNHRIRKITPGPGYRPHFIAGSVANLTVCQGGAATAINSVLAVTDTDVSQTEVWSRITPALHGTAVAAHTTSSTGGVLTPIGLSYTPATGYSGNDSFKVRITDGFFSDTITVRVTVAPVSLGITGASQLCPFTSTTLTPATSGGAWSSTNTARANVGASSGLVTGVSSGTVTISYTLTLSCGTTYATKAMTINGLPSAIAGTLNVCPSATTVLTDSTAGGTWSSGSPGIASVGSLTGIVTGGTSGIATITYSMPAGCFTTAVATVNSLPTPFSVTGGGGYCIGGTGLHVGLGGSAAGVNYQLYKDGTASGTPLAGTGTSLDFGLQTLAGVYTVKGTSAVTSCTGNMSSSVTITINPLPSPISGASSVCAGSSTILANTGGGTWLSSNPSVATIGSSTGVVNGITIGSTVITYTLPTTCSVTTTVNVSTAPTAITGAGTVCSGSGSAGLTMTTTLASSPTGGLWSSSNTARATVNSTSGEVTGVAAGMVTIAYSLGTGCIVTKVMTVMPSPAVITGTGLLCAGSSTMLSTTTSGGTWSSSTTGIATVTSTGTVNGVTAGMAVISYTASGCSTITIVTVNPVPAAIGGPLAVCVGVSVTETNTVAGGIWSTTSANINIGSSSGVVTGVSAGTAGITYALGSCTVTRTITVNAAPTISGAGGICVGSSTTLTASSSTGAWSSSSMTTATVSSTGVVVGVNTGVATITFTPLSGCAAIKAITVNTAPGVITGTKSICVGANTTLSNVAGGGTWTSGSTLIATINSTSGEVTGWVPGTATITYSLGSGCTVTAVVTVNPLPSAITGTAVMCVGSTSALSSGTTGGVWTSGSTGIATIATTGTVNGIAIGTASISYTNPLSGCSVTRMVTVTSAPDAIIGSGSVCRGNTTLLTNTTPGGTWTSSNPIVAAIGSATGVVSGVNTGSAVIMYSLGPGCRVTKVMTVNPIPAGISGVSAICKGSSTTLTTSAAGGKWITSSTSAIVGSASGIVTGVSGGSAIISYTLPTGCASTYTLSVVAVPAITGIHNMCAWGDTMTVTNGLTTGSYSSALATVMNLGGGVGLVTAHAPGTATITYTIAGLGCSTSSTITVNPLPGVIGGTVNICAGGSTTLTMTSGSGGIWSSSTPAVASIGSSTGALAAISGGTSTIVYTLPTGCKVDTVITVSTFPVAGTIAGAVTVCSGATSALSMTGGSGSGVWNSSDVAIASITSVGIVTGITSGAVTITYTVTNVCGVAKAMKFITVNATPSVGAITGIDSVCVGSIVALSNTAIGGIWSMSGVNAAVTSTGIVSGLVAGLDTVYYTVTENGCTAMAILPVKIIPLALCLPLGAEVFTVNDIHVYPNPNDGTFTISGTMLAVEDILFTITNMLGQAVYSKLIRLQNRQLYEQLFINKDIANGMYLLTITTNTSNKVFHIVIER